VRFAFERGKSRRTGPVDKTGEHRVSMYGKVYLVGAGPGAADLLTVRAVRLLEQADVVLYDALVQQETLALAPRARKIEVGKRCGKHSVAQRFINKMLVATARKYLLVVRLKGGDPMLFGRAQEEIDALREAGIELEIVPGVTAALAASAHLQTSLTQRGVARSVVFLTPRHGVEEQEAEWLRAALAADTSVFYMGAGQAQQIARALLAAGKPAHTPVAIVQDASLPQARQWHTTLANLESFSVDQWPGPATIVLGEVIGLAQQRQIGSIGELAHAHR
jgi:uroporphyrin-III C-methyltransferase